MFTISNLSFSLGNKQLYNNCNLKVTSGDRIGLVGANGSGKSTLFRIINGEIRPDAGEVKIQDGVKICFLNQDHLSYKTKDSIMHIALQAFPEVAKLDEQFEIIKKKIDDDPSDSTLYEEIAKIEEEKERLGVYRLESMTEKVLMTMGFKTLDFDRPLEEFSGGWRMRVMLAKMQLQNPSLILLDEPTNHLDIEAIKWLEEYLLNYDKEKAFIVISHDRYFLNNITNKIVELSDKKDLVVYSGNYDSYEIKKSSMQEQQQKAYEFQQKEIGKMERFIERFGAKATKDKQAKSLEKRLDKMERIDPINNKIKKIRFNFTITQQSGGIVTTLKDVEKKYGLVDILKNSSRVIERGDKIALIGENGKGKSTLLRMIYNSKDPSLPNYEPVTSGEIITGINVIMAFYAQHQLESLNLDNNILEELLEVNKSKLEEEIRKICGMFLFTKDDVYKKIRVLSGGEKARVALIKVLLLGANFLLLDEPTNHLDMISINILTQAIQQYQGTCVIVSHDRYFVSKIATKIWYIKDMVLKEYQGKYEDFAYFEKRNEI